MSNGAKNNPRKKTTMSNGTTAAPQPTQPAVQLDGPTAAAAEPPPTVPINGGFGRFASYSFSGTAVSGGEVVQNLNDGYVNPYFAGVTFTNYVPSTGGSNVTAGGSASYGLDVYSFINNNGVAKPGALASIQGFATGDQTFAVGVSGVGMSFTPGVSMLGLAGVAGAYGAGSVGVGLYAAYNMPSDNGVEMVPEKACILADNRSSDAPLFLGRSLNGQRRFEIDKDGRIVTEAPAGSQKAAIRFGISGEWMVVEVGGVQHKIKLMNM